MVKEIHQQELYKRLWDMANELREMSAMNLRTIY